MENSHKLLIQRNFEVLVRDLISIDHIIRILVNKAIFSAGFVEKNKTKTSLDRKRMLFHHIPNCGKTAFTELVLALRDTNQEKLANLLDPKRKYETATPTNHKTFVYDEFNINVVNSSMFCDVKGEVPTYTCRSINRGVVLIANNNHFHSSALHTRIGSEHDVANLKKLFSGLNFQIELVEDQSGEDLEKAIKEFFQNNDKYDCLFAILMSHGGQDCHGTYVNGIDNYRLYTHTIEHYASNCMASQLCGIPKVLLYNICRGDKTDFGTRAQMSTSATESAATVTVQSFSDVLIGNATVNDFVAHRDYEKGAWYISNLVDVMAKHAHAHHMEDMLKMVFARVMNYRSAEFSMQTPTYTNIGFKQLYLNPGIYEEGGVLKRFDNIDCDIEMEQNESNGNVDCETSTNAVLTKENFNDTVSVITGDTVENE